MNFPLISQICGYLGTAAAVVGFQVKKREALLISQIAANLLVSLSFIFIGKPTGGLICFIATGHTILNFCLAKREKNPTWWMNAIFITLYLSASVFSWVTAETFRWTEILPLVCAGLFFLAITFTKGRTVRLCFLANAVVWIAYDLLGILAVANLVTHLIVFASNLISVIRFDIIGKRTE